ncbi:MAG: hypothetical protein MSH30_01445 [Campylobacter sp.]|uniref:hypothetical protein n=1 Tax=Campylobacter sp. TaxID=205 RepID=UPI002AA86744|nr:hypothetical protein [Campylobacter sp.]MCI6343176.1 hypothetical protein [Campylobacter sp.]MCI7361983.1 hypothetical protein [Campylobacter sp.]
MKKVLLALFLIFSFASSADVKKTGFSITDENNDAQADAVNNLKIDIKPNGVRRYKIKATNISPNTTIIFENTSQRNILFRFNAGATSTNQDGATSNSQIIYQIDSQADFSTSDSYALSSCEVGKNTQNIPTRSFFIINRGQKKFLKFSLRDCDTGKIKTEGKLSLETTLSVLGTDMFDTSVDHKEKKTRGLPTVIIGKETVRDLSIMKGGKEEFLCRTRNNIESIELYDGSNNKIESFFPNQQNRRGTKINFTDATGRKIIFTIENKKGTNYRKMYFQLTCNKSANNASVKYYFDARPKEIQVSDLPENEWLYAEQKYKSDDGSAYKDGFSEFIEIAKAGQKGFLLTKAEKEVFEKTGQEFFSLTNAGKNCDNCEIKVVETKLESKKMKPITLTPVDADNKPIEDYNSISEVLITGKIYSDGSNQNIINEKSGNTLIRPCVAGSRANCEIALAEINGATKKSQIYTAIDIINNQKVLAYNNVGPTVLYGADTEWTKYSQTYKAEDSGPTPNQESTLCNKFESHSNEKRVMINGKPHNLVGCNIPFVPKGGGDEINFYSFKPAFYKLIFDNKNSPANDSYGTNKLTYIHTIKEGDYDTTKNEIFEAADFKPSILAIGASLDSLRYNRALSHYDNNLKVAKKLKFSGNPANPTITIDGSDPNGIAVDFSVTASNNSNTDINDAIMLTLEPKNPYNHESGYKDSHISKDITTEKDNININMPGKNFYAGKNIEVNKLNFKREDLLARSYAHIGKSSLDIKINEPKNAELSKKITDDKAAFIFSYIGDDLNFVDAAIIAPNVASNETTADGAVYLAGFCDPESHAACRESGLFISDTIAGHINYFGFDFLAYGKHGTDIKESATGGLFDYDQATFAQFKRGADFLRNLNANEVKIQLKGDKAREYCNIFRNCYPLAENIFGTTFDIYKGRNTQWHGGGDQQGDTIVDGAARRKEQRLNF